MKQIITFFDDIPTTRIRILVTIGLIAGTGVTYINHACDIRLTSLLCASWEPSTNWLMFLCALAGVDVTQYAAKSFTGIKQAQTAASVAAMVEESEELPPEVSADSTASTDVSELHTTEQKG